MGQMLIEISAGLAVLMIATWFGIGGTTKITLNGGRTRKSGKILILISLGMIIGGLAWASSNSPIQGGFDFNKPGTIYGLTLTGYGFILLILGKVVAWFQKP